MHSSVRPIPRSAAVVLLAALHVACGGSSTGANGKTTLLATAPEPAGANCAAGGQRVQVGLDADDDGALDAGEISRTVYLCDGAAGPGPTVTAEQAGAHCAAGGVKLESGTQTTYLCNGAPGVDGQSVQVDDAGEACPHGGLAFQVGDDDARYVCNGADGQSVEIDDAGEECEHGGLAFRVGEGDAQYVCNGAPGRDGASATVTPADEDLCPSGGAVIQVGDGNPVSVCNGQSVTVTYDDGEYCDDGGYLLRIGDQEPVPVCNGRPGDDGADGACAYNRPPSIDWIDAPTGPIYRWVNRPLVVHASDQDGDRLTYSVSGAGALLFEETRGSFVVTPTETGNLNFSVLVSDGCQLALSSFRLDDVLPGWIDVGEPPAGPDVYSTSIAVAGRVPYVSYRAKDEFVRVAKYEGAWKDTGFRLHGEEAGYFSAVASHGGSIYLATGRSRFFQYDGTGWTTLASYHGGSNMGQVKLFSDGHALFVAYLFQNEEEEFYRIGVERYDPDAEVWFPVGYDATGEGVPGAEAYQATPAWWRGSFDVGGFDFFVESGTPYVLFPAASDRTLTVTSYVGEGWWMSQVPDAYAPGAAHLAVAGGVAYVARSSSACWRSDGGGWVPFNDFAPAQNPAMAVYQGHAYVMSYDLDTGGAQLRRIDGATTTAVANDMLTDVSDFQVALTIADGAVWSPYVWFSPTDDSYGLAVMKLVLPGGPI